jgi:hypothetical protein
MDFFPEYAYSAVPLEVSARLWVFGGRKISYVDYAKVIWLTRG